MVQQSIIVLALLSKFVNEYRENNTFVIQEKTALLSPQKKILDLTFEEALK